MDVKSQTYELLVNKDKRVKAVIGPSSHEDANIRVKRR